MEIMTYLQRRRRRRNYAREKQQKADRYRRDRAALIAALGGQCVEPECGETDPTKLEFDHLEPRDWTANQVNRLQRLRIIRREIASGKIELRCRSCNARKGQPCGATGVAYEELPL